MRETADDGLVEVVAGLGTGKRVSRGRWGCFGVDVES